MKQIFQIFGGDERDVNVHFCKATQMQHSYFKYRLIRASFNLFLSQISYPFYFQNVICTPVKWRNKESVRQWQSNCEVLK